MSILDAVKNVDDYLARFAPTLMGRLTQELRPLYDPSREHWHPRLAELKRRPFPAQGDAVMGLDRVLRRQKFALLVGEMGVGKTLMGAALAYFHLGPKSRTLVMCPGHLVEKWAREIETTVTGARVRIVKRVSDLFALDARPAPEGREFYILPRDRAKLGYRRKAAYILRRAPYKTPPRGETFDRTQHVACPTCAAFVRDRKTHAPLHPQELEAKPLSCASCGGALWQADPAGVRRYAPAEYIKRRLKGTLDLLIADECHELKGGDTAQGNALGMLAAACRKTVCLTGTLVGGYASHLFYILYRINPQGMLAENLRYSNVQSWVARYGAIETVTKKPLGEGAALVYARGRKERVSIRHRPGVSPLVFARHLVASSVFVELADVASQLPDLTEDVSVVPMSDALRSAYKEIEAAFRRLMADRRKAMRYMGAYLATLLSYPDRPFDHRPVEGVGELAELPRDVIYPKEQALLDFVSSELAAHRRVWVYAVFTQTRDVTARLAAMIAARGIKVAVLRQDTVEMSERERWIAEQVKRGVQVVVSNPELVKTGLDLLAFPSLAFYETGWNTFTLLQASRRSWRVGQKLPVKVRYYCYKDTLQEAALRLMGAKVKATQALQGRFSTEGLTALTQSEDMMTALAKALVNGLEGVESAETYWRTQRRSASTGSPRKTQDPPDRIDRPAAKAAPPRKRDYAEVQQEPFLPFGPSAPQRTAARAPKASMSPQLSLFP